MDIRGIGGKSNSILPEANEHPFRYQTKDKKRERKIQSDKNIDSTIEKKNKRAEKFSGILTDFYRLQ